jgi:ElaB/YqjD/DUF883 family membrane-anchored ribosome-binding protein
MTTPYHSQDEYGRDPAFEPAPDALDEDFAADRPIPAGSPETDLARGDVRTAELGSTGDGHGEQATQEAGKVAGQAKQGGQQVAQTAKQELGQVTSTVGEQTRSLVGQTRSELTSQAGNQQQRIAEGIRALGGELQSMAEGSQEQGVAVDLARQASERSQAVASWLEDREPGDLLEEVKSYARRHPGTFIAVAAGIGLLAGRLTRGLTEDGSSTERATGAGVGGVQPVGHGSAPGTAPGTMPPSPVGAADVFADPTYTDPTYTDDVQRPPLGHHDPAVSGTTGPGRR